MWWEQSWGKSVQWDLGRTRELIWQALTVDYSSGSVPNPPLILTENPHLDEAWLYFVLFFLNLKTVQTETIPLAWFVFLFNAFLVVHVLTVWSWGFTWTFTTLLLRSPVSYSPAECVNELHDGLHPTLSRPQWSCFFLVFLLFVCDVPPTSL